MLKKLFENRTARVVSTALLLLLALGAIAAAWAAPGRSGGPGALGEHGPPSNSNSVHQRGLKPDRTAFDSGCSYGAAVAQWASGKAKDASHCSSGENSARGASTKPPKATSKQGEGKNGAARPSPGPKEKQDDGDSRPTPTPSVTPTA
jgi:hypothetical protein